MKWGVAFKSLALLHARFIGVEGGGEEASASILGVGVLYHFSMVGAVTFWLCMEEVGRAGMIQE